MTEKIWINEALDEGFKYAVTSNQLLHQRQSRYQVQHLQHYNGFTHWVAMALPDFVRKLATSAATRGM